MSIYLKSNDTAKNMNTHLIIKSNLIHDGIGRDAIYMSLLVHENWLVTDALLKYFTISSIII